MHLYTVFFLTYIFHRKFCLQLILPNKLEKSEWLSTICFFRTGPWTQSSALKTWDFRDYLQIFDNALVGHLSKQLQFQRRPSVPLHTGKEGELHKVCLEDLRGTSHSSHTWFCLCMLKHSYMRCFIGCHCAPRRKRISLNTLRYYYLFYYLWELSSNFTPRQCCHLDHLCLVFRLKVNLQATEKNEQLLSHKILPSYKES